MIIMRHTIKILATNVMSVRLILLAAIATRALMIQDIVMQVISAPAVITKSPNPNN